MKLGSFEIPPFARLVYLLGALALVAVVLVFALRAKKRGHFSTAGLIVAMLGLAPLVYVGLVHVQLIRETYVRFNAPEHVFLPAIAGCILGWRLSQLPMRMGRGRQLFVWVFSVLSVFAAAIAATDPEIGRPLDRLTILVAVDRSRSIDLVPGAETRIRSELRVAEKGMREDDRIGTIVFGGEAATEDPPRPKSDLPPPQRIEVGRDGTDLEGAIRRALAELPADSAGRIVLLTDGVQTRGDALAGAAAAVAADVPIDVVVLEQKVVPDVRVVSVRAPTRADQGEPIDLRVVTSSGVATDVEVRIKRDGELLHKSQAHIGAGEDVLRVREIANEPGLHRYDVEVSALDPSADGSPEDNTGSTFVKVRGPALALILEGDQGKGAPLAKALESFGFHTQQRTTMGVPTDIGGLAGFDLVVLSDVKASDLAPIQMDALASYARDLGGGLVLMGGDRSLGPGGFARTPIEEVSPVSFDLKQEKRRASLAEVIAIDYSGSMAAHVGGQTKLALANEAAARSASLLGPGDKLGVEHVDDRVAWTIPLGPVSDTNAIAAKIRSVQVGGGGIYTDIALKAGYASLDKETVNLKHMLLFADGDDAEQLTGCRALVSGAFSRGITTSVISLGKGHDSAELEVLSKLGGGRFYLIDDATKLPAVFTQETILASKGAISEAPFKASLGAPGPPTKGVDFSTAPELRGYVITVPKPRATLLLGGPENDPLLATWSVGIGRSAAFTSDYKDRWGKNWLAWPGGAKIFGQLGRDTARKSDDPRVRLESDASGGELHVRADVVGDDGRAQTFRRLTVHVAGPDGFSRDVALEAVGAGRYAATVPLTRPGTYVATAKDEVTKEAVGTTGAVLTAGEELRPTGSDKVLLTRLATMTGGKVRDTLAGIYDDRATRRFSYKPIVSPLLWLAGIVMLFAVAARRLGMPSFVTEIVNRIRNVRTAREHARREAAAARAQQQQQELGRIGAAMQAAKHRRTQTPQFDPRALGNMPAPPPPGAQRPVGPPPIAPPTPGAPPVAAGPPPPAQRELTAAERLAQRRRERK